MNRELKFRAFVVTGDKPWMAVQGNHTEIDTPAKFLTLYGDHEVMRYTGLKDKNGVEIYEGDIVLFHFKVGDVKRLVSWSEKDYAWRFNGFHYDISDLMDCEVVGNIYETPELLQ